MTTEMSCERVRDLVPEVALDIAGGEERDEVLRHLASCSECRRFVSEISTLGDELLLLLAPPHEPTSGFETRVLNAIADRARQPREPKAARRGWRRVALAAAAVVIVAAFGGASVFLTTADDRRLAQSYRAALEQGRGSFFASAPLQGPSGRLGTVFGYEGRPSWVMVTLEPTVQERSFRVEILTVDSRYIAIGEAVLGGDDQAWGRQLPLELSMVHQIRFLDSNGQAVLSATFDAQNPWE